MNNATRIAIGIFIGLAVVAAGMATYAYFDVIAPARALERRALGTPTPDDLAATPTGTPRASASATPASLAPWPPVQAWEANDDDAYDLGEAYDDEPEEWDYEEDSASDPYDVEAWALGCSAIAAKAHDLDPFRFGMMEANPNNAARAKNLLAETWEISHREGLLETLSNLANEGYSASFAEDYRYCSSLSDEEFGSLLEDTDVTSQVMWPLTQQLGDKWGDQEILAWDKFSMFTLAGWGYIAGYLELQEAYDLLEPAIDTLRNTFYSWDEAAENYLDGYAWWSASDLSDTASPYWMYYDRYQQLLDDPNAESLFDSSLWY